MVIDERLSVLGVTASVRDATVPAVGHEPAEPGHTITGEISGVEIRKEMKCSRCHQTQETFNEEACTHKCEKCNLLQRSQRYACILSGTLVVLSEGTEATLMLPSPVIMKYLQANNLGDLLEHPDSLEKHFLGNAQFLVSYDGEVVSALTMMDQSGDNKSL